MVIDRLERNEQDIKDLEVRVNEIIESTVAGMHIRLSVLEIKAGMWGAIASLVVVVGSILIQMYMRGPK